MKPVEVEHYPFRLNETASVIDQAIIGQMRKLVGNTIFSGNRNETLWYLLNHYRNTSEMFFFENEMRENGFKNANLYYHGSDHFYQTTFDGLTISQALLSREDKFSSHMTPEGVFSIPFSCIYHDTGFVYQTDGSEENFAAKNPVHVERSKYAAVDAIKIIGLPTSLNTEKVTKLTTIGIHRTYFPYNEKRQDEERRLIGKLPPEWRKEAHIVGLAVQFADLGGQTARVDQNPEGLRRLREEMNACTPDMGTKIIGKDEHEMEEKRKQFLNFVIERTVGRTGNAFFGTREHSYAREWYKTHSASR